MHWVQNAAVKSLIRFSDRPYSKESLTREFVASNNSSIYAFTVFVINKMVVDGTSSISFPLLIKKFPSSFLIPHERYKTPSEPQEKLQIKFTEEPGNTATVCPRYLDVNWNCLEANGIENQLKGIFTQ